MLKGFKEFLARGNIVDLAVAVVIGTAFTALVTKFTDSIITPLITRVGVNQQTSFGILRLDIGGGQAIDLNILVSAAINFVLIAAVVYFLIVLPYNRLRKKVRSSRRTTRRWSCSPRSGTCWPKPTAAARRASMVRRPRPCRRRPTTGLARTPDPRVTSETQISRLDNCPMI
ncbi:Large-conductance mechanosensitive channel [Mycobacterium persicum]|uniref:Large-conductance mechanosensitive channel n=1 Tax=Mycobacterium persicum TaxID=1487726 RepID=A0AB38UYJ2_9MYCO|nr:Large-conductance mechanosensitive channel [Mycobacterium persicum]